MKFEFRLIVLFLFFSSLLFPQQEIKTFLLNKEEYKYLEANNLLISKAIENAFGNPSKQNCYKLKIHYSFQQQQYEKAGF